MYRFAIVIFFRVNSKTKWQMFVLMYGGHVGAFWTALTWRRPPVQSSLNLTRKNTFSNSPRMKNRIYLVLREIVYISIIYHIADSWLSLLNVYDLHFWLHDSANHHDRANNLIKGSSPKETNVCKCLLGGWGLRHQILSSGLLFNSPETINPAFPYHYPLSCNAPTTQKPRSLIAGILYFSACKMQTLKYFFLRLYFIAKTESVIRIRAQRGFIRRFPMHIQRIKKKWKKSNNRRKPKYNLTLYLISLADWLWFSL